MSKAKPGWNKISFDWEPKIISQWFIYLNIKYVHNTCIYKLLHEYLTLGLSRSFYYNYITISWYLPKLIYKWFKQYKLKFKTEDTLILVEELKNGLTLVVLIYLPDIQGLGYELHFQVT